jgi:hypothetical protein
MTLLTIAARLRTVSESQTSKSEPFGARRIDASTHQAA